MIQFLFGAFIGVLIGWAIGSFKASSELDAFRAELQRMIDERQARSDKNLALINRAIDEHKAKAGGAQ